MANDRVAALNAKAIARVARMTLDQLLDAWEYTEGKDCSDPAIPTMRGWLMDRFEEIDPVAFGRYIEDAGTPNAHKMAYYFKDGEGRHMSKALRDSGIVAFDCQ